MPANPPEMPTNHSFMLAYNAMCGVVHILDDEGTEPDLAQCADQLRAALADLAWPSGRPHPFRAPR